MENLMEYKGYKKIENLLELQSYIEETSDDIVWVAGATDIMVKARARNWYSKSMMVDISNMKELSYIKEDEDIIEVGALTTIASLLESDIIYENARILWEACKVLGNPQIRNSGTIGGNIANACLAADTFPALCVLGAQVKVMGSMGERIVGIEEIMKKCPACLNHEAMTVSGCYYGIPAEKKTTLKANECIRAIMIPKMSPAYRVDFQKIGRKQAGCMSKFTLAVGLLMEENIIQDIRVSIGAAFDTITVHPMVSERLVGTEGNKEQLVEVANYLGDAIEAQVQKESKSISYKAEVCRRLTVRVIEELIESAKK